MPKRCKYTPTLLGGKAIAYGIDARGARHRLTRQQLISGELPEGVTEVVFTPVGHTSDHALSSDPGLLRLSPQEAAALVRGGADASRPLSAAGETSSEVVTTDGFDDDAEGPRSVTVRITYDTYQIGGRSVVFGGVPGVTYDAEVIPRNPYVISGHPPDTPEGREAALAYVYAQVAIVEGRRGFCSTCRFERSCTSCARTGVHTPGMGAVSHLIPRNDALMLEERRTVVDALLARASGGDVVAQAELKALATAGRTLVRAAARGTSVLTPDLIRTEIAPYAQALEERSRTRELDSVRSQAADERLRRMDADLRQRIALCEESVRECSRELSDTAPGFNRLETDRRDADAEPLEARRETLRQEIERQQDMKSALQMIEAARAHGTAALDGDGLRLVHETSYDIERDGDGNILLRPRGDWEADGGRDSVHFGLNGRAAGHLMRTGADARRALVIDLKRLLETNPGAVSNIYPVDTRVVPPPRTPIVLPPDAVVSVEYSSDDTPEERSRRVEDVLRAAGAPVFPSGQHHSSREAESVATVAAVSLGVGNAPEHSTWEAENTYLLLCGGAAGGRSIGNLSAAGPILDAWAVHQMGENGALRLFDRGGEPPLGRRTERAWSGADIRPAKAP
jgi:hypothetical protein